MVGPVETDDRSLQGKARNQLTHIALDGGSRYQVWRRQNFHPHHIAVPGDRLFDIGHADPGVGERLDGHRARQSGCRSCLSAKRCAWTVCPLRSCASGAVASHAITAAGTDGGAPGYRPSRPSAFALMI